MSLQAGKGGHGADTQEKQKEKRCRGQNERDAEGTRVFAQSFPIGCSNTPDSAAANGERGGRASFTLAHICGGGYDNGHMIACV